MKQNIPRYAARKPATKKSTGFSWISPEQVRTLIIIFGLSFGLSLLLELYVFGFPDGFFTRWFSALLVIFLLLSLTVMAIIPLVTYVVNRWLRF